MTKSRLGQNAVGNSVYLLLTLRFKKYAKIAESLAKELTMKNHFAIIDIEDLLYNTLRQIFTHIKAYRGTSAEGAQNWISSIIKRSIQDLEKKFNYRELTFIQLFSNPYIKEWLSELQI